TFKGAGELISEKDDFLELVKKVASRRGTTEKALLYFKKKNFKRIVKEAIEKANKRAEELSK
ncbi:MAG: pyrroline-5-carboxylate reductase, partial [Candidatus Omnitrophota bacterium]